MENLKKRRLALNMTQTELAETFGVTSTTLAKWERGDGVPQAPGMLELALEALETRQLLDSPEFSRKVEQVKSRVAKTSEMVRELGDDRQRVKHPRKVAT